MMMMLMMISWEIIDETHERMVKVIDKNSSRSL